MNNIGKNINIRKVKQVLIKIFEIYIDFSILVGGAVIFQYLSKIILKFDETFSAVFGFVMGFTFSIINFYVSSKKKDT